MKSEASEARKITHPTRSKGCPHLLAGTLAIKLSTQLGSAKECLDNSVSIRHGAMVLTGVFA
jgi:hypothetical protein